MGVVINGLKSTSIQARTVLPPNMRDEEEEEPVKEKENKKSGKANKKEKKGEEDEPWPRADCDKTITVCKSARINKDVSTVIVKGQKKCRCKEVCSCKKLKLCLPEREKCPENYYQTSTKNRKKWVCDNYSSDSSDDDKCGCKKKDCKKCWARQCIQVKTQKVCVKKNRNVDQFQGQRILIKNCSDKCVYIIPHKKDKIRTCEEKTCKYILEPYESIVLISAGKYWILADK